MKKVKGSGNANFMVNTQLEGDELEVKANDNSLVQFKKPIQVSALKLEVAKHLSGFFRGVCPILNRAKRDNGHSLCFVLACVCMEYARIVPI